STSPRPPTLQSKQIQQLNQTQQKHPPPILSQQQQPSIINFNAWTPQTGVSSAASDPPIISRVVTQSNSNNSWLPSPTPFHDSNISSDNSHLNSKSITIATQNPLQTSLSSSSSTFKYNNQDLKVSCLTISALLSPDQQTEKLLNDLTLEQLSLIEKTIQRVKKKKSKESKKQNNNNFNATIPPSIEESSITLSLSTNATTNINNSATEVNKTNINATKSQPSQFVVQPNHHHLDVNQPPQDQHYQKSIYAQNQHHIQLQQHSSQIYFSQSQPEPEIQDPSPRNSDQLTIALAPNHALPATDPIFEVCDGIKWIKFSYSVKGHNRDYRIRVDIETINVNEMDDQFKHENCLYPRANCTEDKYKGNRWSYENECNVLGWKLAWMNREELNGKRGLLQRAVDSYRNRDPKLRSRRVVRNEKIMKGTLRKRNVRDESHDGGLSNNNLSVKRQRAGSIKELVIESYVHDNLTKIKLRADVETVSLAELTDDFKKINCLFPDAVVPKSEYQGTKWELETTCNELGWKLAHLNTTQLHGNRPLLQTALDMYCEKFIPEFRPRKLKNSHDLSAKFFENYPCENVVDPTSEKTNNDNNTTLQATTSPSVTIPNDYDLRTNLKDNN
ncbi:1866_t:CDS:2, partial [Entrophospora sp. SA101]